jgi:phosphatidylglycerophosphate synthase
VQIFALKENSAMFDGKMRRLIDPLVNRIGQWLAEQGLTANQLSVGGFALALVAAVSIAFGPLWLGLLFVVMNRIVDGLDGAVARATRSTDLGGYLDIVFDFIFYGLVPLAFAIRDPDANALAAAVLLAAFYANGASFLAFAAIAAKRSMTTQARGLKSIYFTSGLAEGTETIAIFVAFCLLPDLFPPIAVAFAVLCFVTTAGRVALAFAAFGDR